MNEKMQVQWFPGHMAKTRRLIKESLPLVDAVCEIVDARLPLSSRNPEIDELTGSKPRIILLNKCDLADNNATARYIDYFEKSGIKALPVDCRSGRGLDKFPSAVREILKEKIQQNIDRGMGGKAIRVMVVGIPNTGKSSFINRMAGRNRAKVADRPGVTRGNQWFSIGQGIELLDTPGVLWPKFEDPEVGFKLSFIGSVKDEILDIQEIAVRLLDVMRRDYRDRLEERYKIDPDEDIENMELYELLELIAKKRGMVLRKGEFDTERAAVMLLDEYRDGKLGKITLD
ncbi:MAG: ribosome biogenesis GTPase YlqF [Clostridia bacterium]|nr:ribosome biogenesis GTPase YlqF [Clostridia bacterium]MBQ6467236.1 ribosome biogenesis GTPase YlqF [Clostridia bacterium]MBR5772185.1 ribosome biogenesis GTPase YlqF [Clostridia bacterium]MBR6335835.1 ribosome biogenesis GTPase YlqF [Clostridia bacterium]